MESVIEKHIETTPGVCGGKARVAGTRVRVQDIVAWTEQGLSPDEIVSGYPHLSLADVHAALAYYYDHREEIDRQMKESDEFVARMKAKYDRTGQQNSPGRNAHGDPLSPG